MTGTGVYWDGTGEMSCDLPIAGVTPDVALGDLTWKTCFNVEQPPDIASARTFVQAVGFVVPRSSAQVAITAEECNVLFRFGASAGSHPLNLPSLTFNVLKSMRHQPNSQ